MPNFGAFITELGFMPKNTLIAFGENPAINMATNAISFSDIQVACDLNFEIAPPVYSSTVSQICLMLSSERSCSISDVIERRSDFFPKTSRLRITAVLNTPQYYILYPLVGLAKVVCEI